MLNDPPEGKFVAVSTGIEHACALRSSGRAECWGSSTPSGNGTLQPDGEYTDIATGRLFICGIRKNDGTVECWGQGFTNFEQSGGRGIIPPGKFTSITAKRTDVCGTRVDGSVECWGNWSPNSIPEPVSAPGGEFPYFAAPEGEFASINVNIGVVCGVRLDESHDCWRRSGAGGLVPPGDFSYVLGKCGALRSGGVECWSLPSLAGQKISETSRWVDGEYVKLTEGRWYPHWHWCGLRPDGGVECWAGDQSRPETGPLPYTHFDEEHPVAHPPSGIFTDITSVKEHACGLRPGGSVECWGHSHIVTTQPLPGAFTKISASEGFTCGLRPTGKIECWDTPYPHSKITPPQEPLTSISAGWGGHKLVYTPTRSATGIQNDWGYSCGLRPDRVAKCWGIPSDRRGDRPVIILRDMSGELTEVQAGRHHACGLRVDKKIYCWGHFQDPRFGYSWTPVTGYKDITGLYPDGIRTDARGYTAFSVGGTYTCGLTIDENIECWDDSGHNTFQERSSFTAVSAGYDHQCGLLTTGDIRCWNVNVDITTNSYTWKTQTYTHTLN